MRDDRYEITPLKKIILLVLFTAIVTFQFWGTVFDKLIQQPIALKVVREENLLIEVKEIHHSRSNKIYKDTYMVLIGEDDGGRLKTVWLDFNQKKLSPTILLEENLLISKEEAFAAIGERGFNLEPKEIHLTYFERETGLLKKGIYWRGFDGKGNYVYVDIHSREVIENN